MPTIEQADGVKDDELEVPVEPVEVEETEATPKPETPTLICSARPSDPCSSTWYSDLSHFSFLPSISHLIVIHDEIAILYLYLHSSEALSFSLCFSFQINESYFFSEK